MRTLLQGSVTMLPGFAEGQWWVQDAAAALPARLFGDIAGKTIADLCAAPGGKTAQLAQAGARVTAVDRSPGAHDAAARQSGAAVAGGRKGGGRRRRVAGRKRQRRIRRYTGRRALHLDRHHPAPPRRGLAAAGSRYRRADGAAKRLLQKAVALLKPGGTLVYCTCSLEPEEGEQAVAALLAAETAVRRAPIDAGEVAGLAEIVTAEGDLRTLPCHLPHNDPRLGGLDGFYAARLVKS